MGHNYSINLYFPTSRLGDALAATARRSPPGPHPQAYTPVLLPEGREIKLPFTTGFEHQPVGLKLGGDKIRLETSLLFPADEAVRSYAHLDSVLLEGREHFPVGYLYLRVRTGCLFMEFSFTAATSGMSDLLVDSAAVRATFGNLLRECGGVTAWVDRETFEFYRLDDPGEPFDPAPHPWEPRVVEAGGEVDRLTEALAHGLGIPVAGCHIDPSWRTANVAGVAEAIRADRAWGRMPILADALTDAGCDNDDILAHCRYPGEHVKDCWVVNLLADAGAG